MPIEFHCNHCGRSVRAPDETGGKHGKCPACHQEVYIPLPDDELAPLTLAPIDESFERNKEALLRETKELTHRILLDREGLPPEKAGDRAERLHQAEKIRQAAAAQPARPAATPRTATEIREFVVNYAVCMSEGRLPDAEKFAVEIRGNLRAAEDVMQQLTVDEMLPPKLSKIPRPVLVGFFKQLREAK